MTAKQPPEQRGSGFTVWRLLTEPLASSQLPEEHRRSAPLLSASLLILLLGTGISVTVSLSHENLEPGIVIALLGFAIAYALSRTRFYIVAALLALIMLSVPPYTATLADTDFSAAAVWTHLVWLCLPVLVSSLLLSVRWTIAIAVINLLGILILPFLHPELSHLAVLGVLGFLFITSGLLISFMYYRNRLEHDRQAELEESEQRYRALFERTNDAVFWVSLGGVHTEVNQQAADMLGYTVEELVGMPVSDVIVPDEHEDSLQRLDDLLAGRELPIYERTFLRKDGVQIPTELNVALVYDSSGAPLHIQSIARDITHRRRNEIVRERLLAALEHRGNQLETAAQVSKSAGMILNPDQLISQAVSLIRQRFNFYYVGLFLVDEAGESAMLHAGTGSAGRQMLAEGHKLAVGGDSMIGWCVDNGLARIALDVGREAVHFTNPFLPETRSELALPLVSRSECIGALTVQSTQEAAFSGGDVAILQTMADQLAVAIENARLYDTVQRHAAELEGRVAERTAELSAVNKELEAFAYSVSHDLRAPLRSIDGFSQALLEDYEGELDAIGQDYLRRVRAASQRMGQLIDDLLQLSRLTRREMHREWVDLSALARATAARLREAEPGREVEFVIAEKVVAEGDERLLAVVMENLLGNAWKFTSKHDRSRIEFGVCEQDAMMAYFVRDDGAGFDMAYAANLFGAFQRLHSVGEFEGTGIGLATVQRIVHRHGGRVWAEGAVEQGAAFYFTLTEKKGG